MTHALVPQEVIEQKIFLIRGQKVMLDRDLAKLYGVSAKRLNEQVRRNISRFPNDFMFQLTKQEPDSLRSHFATLKRGKHRKYLPYAFAEQGVAMLSGVLSSERAIQVNIAIMRAPGKHDTEIQAIFEAIRQLMAPLPEKPKRKIGSHPDQ